MTEGVTAAIINWNGGKMVLKCVRSLMSQSRPPDEVVVVDNGSIDGSLDGLLKEYPGIKAQRNAQNLGFARAANQAVHAASGQWLLLSNLDVEFSRDYIARLIAAGERDARIGSITGKLLRPKTGPSAVVDSTGHILYRNGWAANRGEGEVDAGQWESAGEVFGVTAAAALYRIAMLRDVCDGTAQPFDERFFAYIEDVDLDWRMRWLGWKAWYEPVVGWHHRSATGLRRASFILRHILKNRLLLVADNDLWPQGLPRLPGVLAFTLMTAVQFALESPTAPLGILDALPHVRSSMRRRRFLKARRQAAPPDLEAWMVPFPYRQKIVRKLRTGATRAAAGAH